MSRVLSLQAQIVVNRNLDVLFRTQVSLGGLDGRVAEQELDTRRHSSGRVLRRYGGGRER